jgi:metal-sulfur cluster biosynthetic enzyme
MAAASGSAPLTDSVVRACLDEVVDPCSVAAGSPMGLDGMGLIQGIEIEDGSVQVDVRLTSPCCMMHGYFIDEIEERVGRLPAVVSVDVRFDAGLEWDPSMIRVDHRRRREERLRQRVERLRGSSDVVGSAR